MEQSKYWDLFMEKLYAKFILSFLQSLDQFLGSKKIKPEKIQNKLWANFWMYAFYVQVFVNKENIDKYLVVCNVVFICF